MKKSILLLLALILAACASAPHLTPDTSHLTLDTPHLTPDTSHLTLDTSHLTLPTPTVHPQFLSLQAQLASSGETYTLNQNGEIEMQTEDGMTIVPDIQVHPDGIMTFTHDGQEMTADPDTLEINGQTITFKDTEGKTWVFDGENWEETESEAVKLAKQNFTKIGIDPNAYEFNIDGDTVVAIDPQAGEEVYRNGFDLRFLVINFDPSVAKGSPYKPGNQYRNDPVGMPGSYWRELCGDGARYVDEDMTELRQNYQKFNLIYLGRTNNKYVWGCALRKDSNSLFEYIAYMRTDGKTDLVPIQLVGFYDIVDFYANNRDVIKP